MSNTPRITNGKRNILGNKGLTRLRCLFQTLQTTIYGMLQNKKVNRVESIK